MCTYSDAIGFINVGKSWQLYSVVYFFRWFFCNQYVEMSLLLLFPTCPLSSPFIFLQYKSCISSSPLSCASKRISPLPLQLVSYYFISPLNTTLTAHFLSSSARDAPGGQCQSVLLLWPYDIIMYCNFLVQIIQ